MELEIKSLHNQLNATKDGEVESKRSRLDILTESVVASNTELQQVVKKYNDSIVKLQLELKGKVRLHAQKVNIAYQLKQQIDARQVKRQDLIKKNAKGIQTIETLNSTIEQKKKMLESKRQFNRELSEEFEALVHTDRHLMKAINELNNEVQREEANKFSSTTEVNRLNKKIMVLKGKSNRARERYEIISVYNKNLVAAIESKKVKIDSETQEIVDVKSNITKNIKVKNSLTQKQDEVQAELFVLVENKNQLNLEQDLLKQSLSELDQRLEKLTLKQDQVLRASFQFQNEISVLEKAINGNVQRLKLMKKDIFLKQQSVKVLLTDKKSLEKIAKTGDAKLLNTIQVKNSLNNEVKSLEQHKQTLEQNISTTDVCIKKNINDLDDLTLNIGVIKSQIDQYKVKMIYAKDKKIESESNNAERQRQHDQLVHELEILKHKLGEEDSLISILNTQKDEINKRILETQSEVQITSQRFNYSQTYKKNLEHILNEKNRINENTNFEKSCIDNVVRYLATDTVTAKQLEKRLRQKFIFLDVKANYLISDIPLATIEKFERVISDLYDYSLHEIDNHSSPNVIIKNFEQGVLNTTVHLYAVENGELDIKSILARAEQLFGHKLSYFINKSASRYSIELSI
jgi:chromosome segregation ATPase